jgi:polyisoprenoid-binding protein YceI
VITGQLDLHGTTRTIELRAEPVATSGHAQGPRRVTYSARGQLDRQQFGLHWNQDLDVGGLVVSDQIEIAADIELVLRSAGDARAADDDPPAPGFAR